MSSTKLDSLWDTYHTRVFSYFYKRLNSRQDVEDLTSLTMTSFLTKMSDSDNVINKPDNYIWRIAHNQLALFLRDKYKQPVMLTYEEDWEFIDESLETHRSSSYQHRIDALKQCVENQLSETDLEIVQLSIFDDLKSADVALKVNMTADAVRQRLSRAIKNLKSNCQKIWHNYQAQS